VSINPSIFKSYDIRGIYPTQLDGATAYTIGRAFAVVARSSVVTVGRDMRLSGDELFQEFVRGVTDEGVDVVDIGLVPIDAIYFTIFKLHSPASVMITASHNPKDYNGFKMVTAGMTIVRGEALKAIVDTLSPVLVAMKKGSVTTKDIWAEYLAHVLSFVDMSKIKPLRVVVDAGNGMAGKVVPLLTPHVPIEIIPLNFELDGNFPAHPSNPLLPESQVQVSAAVIKHQADCGVIFDGDTDRLFFVDEQGKFIKADQTLLLLARELLRREPGTAVAYNAICSKIVPEKIIKWGGVPIRTKVGFVNVSAGVKQNNGIMGGELSAHYCFRDNGYADSGFIAWLLLLQIISSDGRKLSQIVSEFQKYHKSDEINLEINDRAGVVAALKARYTDGTQDELDGLTVTYPTWWFNVRASNTEPLLRVTVEADTSETLKQKTEELVAHSTGIAH
jgi:phosphomannomutase